mgnify:CR=1 FL=1
MDIKNLVTFIHVAELRSFTKAGDKLGYSQSTVSFQIRQLENELGVPLSRAQQTNPMHRYADGAWDSSAALCLQNQ